MTAATSTSDTRHIRKVLPLGLIRDLLPTRPAQPPALPEPPSAVRVAIVRWLNEEL